MSEQNTQQQNDEISVEELEEVAGGVDGLAADEEFTTNNSCPTSNYRCS